MLLHHQFTRPDWTRFIEVLLSPDSFYSSEATAHYAKVAEESTPKKTLEEVRDVYLTLLSDQHYQNSHFRCVVRDSYNMSLQNTMRHVSVIRIDNQPIDSWRDMQAIKNIFIGPKCEAVQLYPAEDRCVDVSNQYHLWGVLSSDFQWPVGWSEGRVVTGVGDCG